MEEESEQIIILNKVKVDNPTFKANGKIYYTISGYDKDGFFEKIEKRYSDFSDLHDWLSKRYFGLYIPEIPPKKAIGNKDSKFIEERRFMLEDFLHNLTRHKYLYSSDEYNAWVRTNNTVDRASSHKEKIKNKIKSINVPNVDGELIDRIERYDLILSQLRKTPEFEKKIIDSNELLKIIDNTYRFANINIPWLKNMSNVFKNLSDKNERYLASQLGLQKEIEDYRNTVSVKNGSKSAFTTQTEKINSLTNNRS